MAGLCGRRDRQVLTGLTALSACVSFAFLCIAVGTDHWLYATELVTDANQTTSRMRTHSGLWKYCQLDGEYWSTASWTMSTGVLPAGR